MSILESTGIGALEYYASFLFYSSTNKIVEKIGASGEYKALLIRLRDPEAHEQLFVELQTALKEKHTPGYANPLDIAVLACRLAVHERQFYHKKWDDLVIAHQDELNYGRHSVYGTRLQPG